MRIHKNHKIQRIQLEINANNENIEIPYENQDNHENQTKIISIIMKIIKSN